MLTSYDLMRDVSYDGKSDKAPDPVLKCNPSQSYIKSTSDLCHFDVGLTLDFFVEPGLENLNVEVSANNFGYI